MPNETQESTLALLEAALTMSDVLRENGALDHTATQCLAKVDLMYVLRFRGATTLWASLPTSTPAAAVRSCALRSIGSCRDWQEISPPPEEVRKLKPRGHYIKCFSLVAVFSLRTLMPKNYNSKEQ